MLKNYTLNRRNQRSVILSCKCRAGNFCRNDSSGVGKSICDAPTEVLSGRSLANRGCRSTDAAHTPSAGPLEGLGWPIRYEPLPTFPVQVHIPKHRLTARSRPPTTSKQCRSVVLPTPTRKGPRDMSYRNLQKSQDREPLKQPLRQGGKVVVAQ